MKPLEEKFSNTIVAGRKLRPRKAEVLGVDSDAKYSVGDVVLARNPDMILGAEVGGVKFHFLHETQVMAKVEE